MTRTGFASRIQPAEWPLLAFCGYAGLRAAFAGGLSLGTGAVPPIDLVVPFITVVTLRLLLRYRETPWPAEFEHRRILHNVMLGVFLLVSFMCLVLLEPPKNIGGGAVAPILAMIDLWLSALLIAVVSPLLLWLIYGLHLKKHGAFKPSFFREAGGLLGSGVRAWFPLLALVYAYSIMGPILSYPLFPDRDAALYAIDKAMFFGHDPHAWMESIIRPALSEWLAAVYISYTFLYPVTLGAIYAKRDPKPFHEVAFAASFALACGYVTYTFVPAQGPVFTLPHHVSLDFYYLGFVKEQLMDRTRVPRDCFPSLHTCMSLLFLYYAMKHVRPLAWVIAPIVISIPFACVYLRYHYVIDIVAGLALFGITVLVTRRVFANRSFAPELTQTETGQVAQLAEKSAIE
ncbi:MAG: phosphatase PAP2 family protein [Polyangiaceae bacterium]